MADVTRADVEKWLESHGYQRQEINGALFTQWLHVARFKIETFDEYFDVIRKRTFWSEVKTRCPYSESLITERGIFGRIA